MNTWRQGSLELCLYSVDEEMAAERGLVWSNSPIYCAASVTITADSILINQSGMHGLNSAQHQALLAYLVELYPNLKVL